MILELTNPSDAVTFIGDDPKIAGVTVLILGNGCYGLTDEKGNEFVPLMIFGSHESWLADNGIDDLGAFIETNAAAIADFLDTCAYGHIRDRQAFDEAIKRMTPENAAEHRKWWNERNRSSMNNIGEGCRRLAAQLRAKAKPDELEGQPPIVLAR